MHDYSAIDKIFRETIDTIRNGQERMFNIAETAREEYIRVKRILEVKDRTAEVIKKVDVFEGKNKLVRRRLAEVSRILTGLAKQT